MTEKMTDQINRLALDVCQKREKIGTSYEFNELYRVLGEWSHKNAKYLVDNPNIDPSIYGSAFHGAIMKALKSYNGVTDFLPLYKTVFKNNLIDELRKDKNAHKNGLSLDSEIYDNDEEGISKGKLSNKRKNEFLKDNSTNDKLNYRNDIEIFYQRFATECIAIKKQYKNKKWICYPPLFFTYKLTYGVFNSDAWFDEIVKRNSNKFDEAAVIDFLNTLVTGKCDSVTDIKKFACRRLSEFTGNQNDSDRLCCDDAESDDEDSKSKVRDPKYHVINAYLKQLGKGITQAAFSPQKNKVEKILKDIKEELQ
ncbi:MAG: hypothetical protein NC120_03685 [Ruminococcus sp.]|nr:hypothetical protein [Ruminococcus sp.]